MNTITVNPLQGSAIRNEIELPQSCRLLEDGEIPGGNQCLFSILTQEDGDKRIVWDTMNIPQIRDAKKLFDDLVSQGFVPYRIMDDGRQEVMSEFDAAAGEVLMKEIVFVPRARMAGG